MKRLIAISLLALCLLSSANLSANAGDIGFPGAVATPTPTCENCSTSNTPPSGSGLTVSGLFTLIVLDVIYPV